MVRKEQNSFFSLSVRLWPLLLLGAVLAVFGVTLAISIGQSVWFDEGYSILLTHHSVGELFGLTAVDAHPPLYYLLLKGWATIFGWHELALRSLSAVLAALTVGTAFFIVKKMFTLKVALGVLPLLVFTPFILRFGYEIRMYALAGLIGALATLVLLYARSSAHPRRLWIVYGVLVALGMYTLYMTIVIWLAHLVWLWVSTVKSRQKVYRQPWFFAFAFAVLLFVPYIPTLIGQLTHSALPGIGSAITLTKFVDIMTMLFLYTPEWKMTGVLSVVFATWAVLMIVLGVRVYKGAKKEKPMLQFALILVAVPMTFFILTSLAPQPVFIPRYLAHVVVYIYMLVGIIIVLGWKLGYRQRAIITGLFTLALGVYGTVQLNNLGNLNFERLQDPQTAAVRSVVDCNGATIVADDPYTYIDSVYYFDGCDLRFFSQDEIAKQGGYAPLAGSNLRISNPQQLTSSSVYSLRWTGQDALFVPDSRYHLAQSWQFDKQVVDLYKLNAE